MNIQQFLERVITTESGYFLLAHRNGTKQFEELWFKWPDDTEKIIEQASKLEGDVYFSSHLFSTCKSTKVNVLPTRTIQADLDNAKLDSLPFDPQVVVKTSDGRHHAYWVADVPITEELSKSVTYAIPNCDLSGWTLGHRMRLPDTKNYKYSPPQQCEVTSDGLNVITKEQIKLLPVQAIKVTDDDIEWLNQSEPKLDRGPYEILESVKDKVASKVYAQYDQIMPDRSAALWALLCSGFRNGLTRDEIFVLAKGSANNKFAEMPFGGIRELKKDIIRAQQQTHISNDDMKFVLTGMRKAPNFNFEKKQAIAKMVIEQLGNLGTYHHSEDDNIWYVPTVTGRPVQISDRSAYLDMLLQNWFSLNPSEIEAHYTVKTIEAHCHSLPADTIIGSVSFYDEKSNTLYLHSGRKDVFRITADSIDPTPNGTNKLLFPWQQLNEPFYPDFQSNIDWKPIVLERVTNNVLNMTPDEASALIEIWFMFLLFRTACVSRPILSLFGQPGAGKSTLFKRLYALLYGRTRELGAVSNPEDFDQAVSSDPLVVLDNVDTWERWLPDRLALSAATSDIIKRRLYTDHDSVVIRRQAVLGLTAHSPKFGREDVADRLLIIMFERLKDFLPEKFLIESIAKNRPKLWMSIIRDIQKVLQTAPASNKEIPQFRIEDFASLGLRISRALNNEDLFRSSLKQVYKEQRLFSLEEESILVSALQTISRKNKGRYLTPTEIWSECTMATDDPQIFTRQYKNAVTLGRKIWSLQESLKTILSIEFRLDPLRGTRVWRIDSA